MATPTTPEDAVTQASLGPKKVSIGGETAEQFTMQELIAAAEYAAKQARTVKPAFGLRMTKLVPPGAG